MKVKIYRYKMDGEILTDSYTEDEDPVQDYSSDECFEFDISESRILEKSKEFLSDHSYCESLIKTHPHLMGCLFNLAHDYINNDIYKGEFKEIIEKLSKDDAISYFVEDLRNQVEKGE